MATGIATGGVFKQKPIEGTNPMSSESASDDFQAPGQQQLFRFGDPDERFESVVHSLFLLIAAFGVGAIFVVVGQGLLQSTGLAGPVATEITTTALHFSGMFLVGLWYLDWRNALSLVSLRAPTWRDLAVILVGAAGLITLLMALDALFSELGLEPAENAAVEAGRENPQLFLYYLPLVLLLNAPAEELLFRGVIQGLFRRAYGIIPAIFAASAIFGLVHYVALVGQGSAMVYVTIAFISGLILGALYEYTGNLLVPTVVHAAWNMLVYLTLYAETTGLV